MATDCVVAPNKYADTICFILVKEEEKVYYYKIIDGYDENIATTFHTFCILSEKATKFDKVDPSFQVIPSKEDYIITDEELESTRVILLNYHFRYFRLINI